MRWWQGPKNHRIFFKILFSKQSLDFLSKWFSEWIWYILLRILFLNRWNFSILENFLQSPLKKIIFSWILYRILIFHWKFTFPKSSWEFVFFKNGFPKFHDITFMKNIFSRISIYYSFFKMNPKNGVSSKNPKKKKILKK